MKRGVPLKRVPFKRRQRAEGPTVPREPKPRAQPRPADAPRAVMGGGSSTLGPAPKECPLVHAGYERAVRGLGYCMRCRRRCRPQFCHADMGKGGSIKTDVRLGWPGCNDCHGLLGGHNGGGRMPKEERRALEADLGRRTRKAVQAAGTWPPRLPMLLEQPDGSYAP